MRILKRVWTEVVQVVEDMEGIGDPAGDHIFSLGKRVDKLERDLGHLKDRLQSRPGDVEIQP